MTDRMEDNAATFEALSVLADGEATERDIARACQAWRESEGARARWHAYQLIGDTLRSDAGGASRSSDAAFLAGVRERLTQEPVVLAPAAQAAARPGRTPHDPLPGALDGHVARQRRWTGPVSVAAGFVLVLGAVINVMNGGALAPVVPGQSGGGVLAQTNGQGGAQALTQASWGAPDLALSPSVSSVLTSGLAADSGPAQRDAAARPTFTQSGRVDVDGRGGYLIFVRDDQLDQLLAARRDQAESRSLVSPSSGMAHQVSFEAGQR